MTAIFVENIEHMQGERGWGERDCTIQAFVNIR